MSEDVCLPKWEYVHFIIDLHKDFNEILTSIRRRCNLLQEEEEKSSLTSTQKLENARQKYKRTLKEQKAKKVWRPASDTETDEDWANQ